MPGFAAIGARIEALLRDTGEERRGIRPGRDRGDIRASRQPTIPRHIMLAIVGAGIEATSSARIDGPVDVWVREYDVDWAATGAFIARHELSRSVATGHVSCAVAATREDDAANMGIDRERINLRIPGPTFCHWFGATAPHPASASNTTASPTTRMRHRPTLMRQSPILANSSCGYSCGCYGSNSISCPRPRSRACA